MAYQSSCGYFGQNNDLRLCEGKQHWARLQHPRGCAGQGGVLYSAIGKGHRHQAKGTGGADTLLKFMRSGDTLMVTRVDRLARSIRDLQNIVHDLKARGSHSRLQSNPSTPAVADKAFLDMLVFAEFETNLRRERQTEGIAAAKAAGRYRVGASRLTRRPLQHWPLKVWGPLQSLSALHQSGIGLPRPLAGLSTGLFICFNMRPATSWRMMDMIPDRWRTTWGTAVCNQGPGTRRWRRIGSRGFGRIELPQGDAADHRARQTCKSEPIIQAKTGNARTKFRTRGHRVWDCSASGIGGQGGR
jgi:hypothetical protein